MNLETKQIQANSFVFIYPVSIVNYKLIYQNISKLSKIFEKFQTQLDFEKNTENVFPTSKLRLTFCHKFFVANFCH